ncbi:ribosome maturation factor RimM [Solemya velesiana gill symbiont]|uniref:Ribosome maturation factor RimM n=1 Tax=Solemya velesiana gill symbiont TaxID=1918948 RepID=A0A1T2KXZ4_9GAMM|nr:ribosome maturation factor RimM [Solemya velesiana gill symbiont]OOZ37729.1 16S rRNA processing protein RimM [Solemya velesiana gill symbiont]
MPDKRSPKSAEPEVAAERDRDSKWVTLGRVSGLFGVRGWVKIYSHTSPRTNILEYASWYLNRSGQWQEYELKDGKAHGKGIIARLSGCDDRDMAAELVGADIAIPRDQLPGAGEDEFYWTDLEGLEVRTKSDIALGRVDYLFETGANDVMVVKGDRQRLIPFIPDVVLEVSLSDGVITVNWDPEF